MTLSHKFCKADINLLYYYYYLTVFLLVLDIIQYSKPSVDGLEYRNISSTNIECLFCGMLPCIRLYSVIQHVPSSTITKIYFVHTLYHLVCETTERYLTLLYLLQA